MGDSGKCTVERRRRKVGKERKTKLGTMETAVR
jgi:hypothetical protein